MNNWQDEFTAEYQRRRIREEVQQIRLERAALKSRAYQPRFFERAMCNFANWMISTGKHLRQRYTRSSPVDEVPAVSSSHPHRGSLAHQ